MDVILAFEDPLRLAGARATIGDAADCRVVCCARTAAEVRTAARAHADVFVFDMALEAREPGLLTHVVATTMARVAIYFAQNSDPCTSVSLALANSTVIDTRGAQPEEFVRLVRAVGRSGPRARRTDAKARSGPTGARPISGRELDVIQQLASGASNKEIARRLGIHQQTVKNHLANITRKIGVSSRVELALFALRYGLIRDPLGAARPDMP